MLSMNVQDEIFLDACCPHDGAVVVICSWDRIKRLLWAQLRIVSVSFSALWAFVFYQAAKRYSMTKEAS
jgi:hypothetical protein